VPEKPVRRRFTAEYKLHVLREAAGCPEPGQIGALLRREGLHSSHLNTWRQQRDNGMLAGLMPKRRTPNASFSTRRGRCPRRQKCGSILRPIGRSPVCYNYRTTLISFRSCLKPVDRFRWVCDACLHQYLVVRFLKICVLLPESRTPERSKRIAITPPIRARQQPSLVPRWPTRYPNTP